MTSTTFVNGVTLSDDDWFNDVNRLHYTIFGDPADMAALVATQANQETATSVALFVTPGRQQFHPSAAKAWVQYDSTGALTSSYNVTSVTDSAAGVLVPVWATDFSSANYVVVGMPRFDGSDTTATTFVVMANNTSFVGGSCVIISRRVSDAAPGDVTYMMVVAFGDQ